MAETGTFSALVDDVILRSARRDRLQDVIAYARSTIRECSVLAVFEQNLVELPIVATTSPHIWERPALLRNTTAVAYPYFDRRGDPVKVHHRKPSTIKPSDLYYFYHSGNSTIFAGIAIGDTINLAYSAYAPRFHYYADATERPATFDDETQSWAYLDAWDDNEDLKQQAEELVSNWLIFYWYDLIIEGTLTKIFKQVGDERSKASFSQYKSQQKDLLAGEASLYVGR